MGGRFRRRCKRNGLTCLRRCSTALRSMCVWGGGVHVPPTYPPPPGLTTTS